MVCTIPASAWTWLVRLRKASAVTMSGAGFDAGVGNPGSVIILQKRLGVGMAAATSSANRGWPVYASSPASRSFRYRVGARAFIVGVVDHSYLITLLPLWLTIPSYPPAMLAVLVMRRAFAGGGCRPYLCQVGCTSTGAPRISGWLPASGRPRRRASCPKGVMTWRDGVAVGDLGCGGSSGGGSGGAANPPRTAGHQVADRSVSVAFPPARRRHPSFRRLPAIGYLKRKETSFCVSWLVSFIGMAECIFRICKYHEELRELEEAEKRLKDQ
ncbi:hypothetical protein BHM03_00029099 [Ensete ventricosum]|nr:hypothetical protein BHM03_00029099 [Ensete ventricosum]